MFGYIVADHSALTDEQLRRYRGCYCGLCRCIGHTYGALPRMALNYDFTFLAMLLSSLYEPSETSGFSRCMVHPFKPHVFRQSECTEYVAALNVALAYHKGLDDWKDDHKVSALVRAATFQRSVQQIQVTYPRQWNAITECMEKLALLEAADHQEPDAGANTFGLLTEELFVWKHDHWEPLLRKIGSALGRYIYLLDAVLDLPRDLKSGSYNPLRTRAGDLDIQELYRPILNNLMGECTDAFERLPLLQDLDILRNILYSGIWSHYILKTAKDEPHV